MFFFWYTVVLFIIIKGSLQWDIETLLFLIHYEGDDLPYAKQFAVTRKQKEDILFPFD